jgi:lipid-binding SYLF domain-containing protein
MKLKNSIFVLLCMSLSYFSTTALGSDESTERLQNATEAFTKIMATPDKSILQELLDGAQCIVIVPGMKKGAFVIGAKYGKGYISCRNRNGVGRTAPGTVPIEAGSFGFQMGGEETAVILLVMNQSGEQKLLSSQLTFGAGRSVAARPVGRSARAETDALMGAEILSWSRTHGVFAGISLQGGTLRQDVGDNRDLYGRTLENREIIDQLIPVPSAARSLIDRLSRYLPKSEKG